MARDPGLEELMRECLPSVGPLEEKLMFGGLVWLIRGHVLCVARNDGALIRLGKGNDHDALAHDGIEPMRLHGRTMHGWIHVTQNTFADDTLARKLLKDAATFVLSLPQKE